MKGLSIILSCFLAIMISISLFMPVQAQPTGTSESKELVYKGVLLKRPKDEMRKCKNRKAQEKKQQDRISRAKGGKPSLLSNISLGNNPREGQYRAEMERLLAIEINNVRMAVKDVEKKHGDLIMLYPQLKNYQEIILEDVPGAYRDGMYVNSKKVIIMHYGKRKDFKSGKETRGIYCVVLDSFTRNIYNPDHWTRKVVRLYYPMVQTLELETTRHNYVLLGSLELASPEIQLKALRLVFGNLRKALYSMDMQIAAYYDLREKKNDWQINF